MKTLSIRSYGIFCAARRSWQPLPMSKRNFSPLPSSTSQHAAACFGRTLGMPVPSATTRISFFPSDSVAG